ncbi:hypothetical protein Tco_0896627, partial [Tanacetum coccineum]
DDGSHDGHVMVMMLMPWVWWNEEGCDEGGGEVCRLWCGEDGRNQAGSGGDDDKMMMRWRVKESGCGDRIDPVMRSVFEVGRKSYRKSFPVAGDGGGGGGGVAGQIEGEREVIVVCVCIKMEMK